MALKITGPDYEYLRKHILANSKAPTWPQYKAQGLSHKRWRWDLMYAAGLTRWTCDTLYKYLNDDHIDSALRRILGDE